MSECGQTTRVVIDPEVVEVSLDAAREPAVLDRDRLMPMTSAVVGHGLDRPLQASRASLPGQMPAGAPVIPAPIDRKAQEIQGPRTLPAILSSRRTPKLDQSSLVRVQTELQSLHPLLQGHLRSLCVPAVLEANDEVIRVPDQDRFPDQSWLHLVFKPHVQSVVQVDVSQDR
jgi:hypothetical protein